MSKKTKENHSIVSNIFFIVKLMFQISPGLVIGDIAVELLTTIPNRLISVIGIKYIIDEISQPDGVKHVFIALAIMVSVLKISSMLCFSSFLHTEQGKSSISEFTQSSMKRQFLLTLQATTIHPFTAILSLRLKPPRTTSVLFLPMSEAMLQRLFLLFQSVRLWCQLTPFAL